MVTAELKEDYDGKPSLLTHPNGPMHFVNDDLSRDLSESDGKKIMVICMRGNARWMHMQYILLHNVYVSSANYPN